MIPSLALATASGSFKRTSRDEAVSCMADGLRPKEEDTWTQLPHFDRSAFVRSKLNELCRGCDCERAVERFHSRNPRLPLFGCYPTILSRINRLLTSFSFVLLTL